MKRGLAVVGGGAGFTGSRVSDRLAAAGAEAVPTGSIEMTRNTVHAASGGQIV